MGFRPWLLLLLLALPAFGQAPTRVVSTLSSLTNVYPGTTQPHVQVQGYATPGDWGPPKTFRWDSTNALATNAIRRATRSGFGRWVHDWDGDVTAFGADPSGVSDSTAALQAAFDYAGATGAEIKLVGGRYLVSTSLVHVSNFKLSGPGTLIRNFLSIKPYGTIRTTNSAFPTWADGVLDVYATNVTISGVTFASTGAGLGTNSGPLLVVDGVDGLSVSRCNFIGNGHVDWALTIGANNVRIEDNFLDVGGHVFQDGIHVWRGSRGVISGNQGTSGDDFIVLSTYDNGITNWVISGNQGRSTHGHLFRANPDMYSAGFAAPVNGIEDIVVDGLVGETGLTNRNGGIRLEDYNRGVYGFDTTNGPGRSIKRVTLRNVSVKTYGVTNSLGWGIEILGGDQILLDNVQAQAPWSAFCATGVRNLTIQNSRFYTPNWTNVSFPTVRFGGYIGGGNYPHTNVTIRNSFIQAARDGIPALSMNLMAGEVKILGNVIESSGTYNPIYLNTYDKMEISDNVLISPLDGVLVFGLGNSLTLRQNTYLGTNSLIRFVGSVTPTISYANLNAGFNEWQTPQALRALSTYATNGYFNRVNVPTATSNYVSQWYTDSSGYSTLIATNGYHQFAQDDSTTPTSRSIRMTFQSATNYLPNMFTLFSGSTTFPYYRMGYGSALNVSPMWWSFGVAGTNNTAGNEVFRLDWPTVSNRTAINIPLPLSTQIVGTVTFTAPPVTGDTITVNGVTATWGVASTSTTIVTNNSITTDTTTLANWLNTNSVGVVTASRLQTTTTTLTSGVNTNLTLSTAGGWSTVALVTNSPVVSRLVFGLPGSGSGRTRAVYIQDPE